MAIIIAPKYAIGITAKYTYMAGSLIKRSILRAPRKFHLVDCSTPTGVKATVCGLGYSPEFNDRVHHYDQVLIDQINPEWLCKKCFKAFIIVPSQV